MSHNVNTTIDLSQERMASRSMNSGFTKKMYRMLQAHGSPATPVPCDHDKTIPSVLESLERRDQRTRVGAAVPRPPRSVHSMLPREDIRVQESPASRSSELQNRLTAGGSKAETRSYQTLRRRESAHANKDWNITLGFDEYYVRK